MSSNYVEETIRNEMMFSRKADRFGERELGNIFLPIKSEVFRCEYRHIETSVFSRILA